MYLQEHVEQDEEEVEDARAMEGPDDPDEVERDGDGDEAGKEFEGVGRRRKLVCKGTEQEQFEVVTWGFEGRKEQGDRLEARGHQRQGKKTVLVEEGWCAHRLDRDERRGVARNRLKRSALRCGAGGEKTLLTR